MKAIKKTIPINYYKINTDMYINTIEGKLFAQKNSIIITNITGEKYPIKPDVFNKTYKILNNSQAIKKPNTISVAHIPYDNFKLKTDWGIQHGNHNDYLANNPNNKKDKWIISETVFKETYKIIKK